MKITIKTIRNYGLYAAALLVAVGSAACGSSTSEDVAYEDDYAGDYYYPADVGYSGVYAGVGYGGIYAVGPAGAGASETLPATLLDGGHITIDAGHITIDAGRTVDAGGRVGTGASTVRGAVGEAIRNAASGGTDCPGQVTVTPQTGTAVCGVSAAGVNIVFNGCQLQAGGTVDGTVNVQITRTASDTNCNASTTISLGYTSTLTNLSYTGTGGGKVVIPNEMSSGTLNYPTGQSPATFDIMTNGEVQRFASGGTMTSDRTFTGTYNLSSISLSNQSYTLGGMLNVTDKAGGTATLTGTNLTRDTSCCRPTGGTLAVSRTGGGHSGSHTWTFAATCGSAMLDNKTVTLPACL
jgi:hypothetical protein